MDTKLSLMRIELAIMNYFGVPVEKIAVCNISYGLLNHEVDVCLINKSNYLTEIEIKRSYSDFMADFNKSHHHDNDTRIKYFYYCVPEKIVEKVLNVLNEKVEDGTLKQLPAVLSYDEEARMKYVKESGKPELKFYKPKALTENELMQFYRLGTFRIYSMHKTLMSTTEELDTFKEKYREGLAIDKFGKKRKEAYDSYSKLAKKLEELKSESRKSLILEEKEKIGDEILIINEKINYYNGKLDAYDDIMCYQYALV